MSGKGDYDCIIPLGDTCNITFLLQNAKLKKQTTLFEWFVSKSLNSITKVISNLSENKIIFNGTHTLINDYNIFTGHYKDNFEELYERRSNRLVDCIKSSKKILFIRFEVNSTDYTYDDIEDFVKSIKSINPDCEVKLLLIGSISYSVNHPCLLCNFYSMQKQQQDPYCEGEEINSFFINALKEVGYNINQKEEIIFNDLSLY